MQELRRHGMGSRKQEGLQVMALEVTWLLVATMSQSMHQASSLMWQEAPAPRWWLMAWVLSTSRGR